MVATAKAGDTFRSLSQSVAGSSVSADAADVLFLAQVCAVVQHV